MALDALEVEIAIVLGQASLPVRRVLRMGRGAVVALDPCPGDAVHILANGLPIASGRVVVQGATISVEVTELMRRPDIVRERGTRIDGQMPSVASEGAALPGTTAGRS